MADETHEPAWTSLVGEAFGDRAAQALSNLRGSRDWLSHLARAGGVDAGQPPTGHVSFGRGSVGDAEQPVAVLAFFVVAPAVAGQGLARRLLTDALDGCREAGETAVVLIGDPALYTRFGFCPAAELGLAPPPHLAAEPFLALSLAGSAPTGVVRYPAAFPGR